MNLARLARSASTRLCLNRVTEGLQQGSQDGQRHCVSVRFNATSVVGAASSGDILKREEYKLALSNVGKQLNLTDKDLPVLRKAFTDETFAELIFKTRRKEGVLVETLEPGLDNGRLSHFGEASFRLTVTEHFFMDGQHLSAEAISNVVDFLTQPGRLASIVDQLGYVPLIRSSKMPVSPDESSLFSKVFFAIIGTLSSTKGQIVARQFVQETVLKALGKMDLLRAIKLHQPKLMLYHVVQEKQRTPPVITQTENEDGTFSVEVVAGKNVLASASGPSAQAAEHLACRDALKNHYSSELDTAPLPAELESYHSEEDIEITK